MPRKKYLIVVAILILLGAYTHFYKPARIQADHGRLARLTRDIPGWTFIDDIQLNYAQYTALDPDSLVFRRYRKGRGPMLTFSVVYHRNDRWGAHDPKICYISQGWEIKSAETDHTIRAGESPLSVRRFVVTKDNVQSLVYYYWFSSNNRFTASRTRQMIDMVLQGLHHGYTESGFVRVSMPFQTDIREVTPDMDEFSLKIRNQLKTPTKP
jgi:EpsI family protein